MNGFDWLNIAGLKSDSDLPPPPVSFGVTPTSSTSSLNLKAQEQAVSRPTPPPQALVETSEDLSVPLSLRADELTRDEAKTYLRWYNDIVVRRGTNVIRLDDVFQFLRNFSISAHSRELLTRIFREVNALNVGEFFAFLRVIAHTILGKIPMRRLIKEPAPIPKPKSILSAKRKDNDDDEEDGEDEREGGNEGVKAETMGQGASFDLDSFTQMLLTGQNPNEQTKRRKKKKDGVTKRIKFSDQVSVEPTAPKTVEPVKIDMSLPMDQLLNQLPKKSANSSQPVNEEEELSEMKDAFSHFQNIKNVDSALIHGTPSNIPSIFFDELGSPNAQSPSPDPTAMRPLAPNHTGPVLPMAPNHTGPVRLLSPSHTGPVPFTNSLLQPNATGYQQQNTFLSPNYAGSNTTAAEPLHPSMTGSYRPSSASPSIARDNTPPVPPQRRSRSASSPIPLDNHVSLAQLAQATLSPDPAPSPESSQTMQQPLTLGELQAQRMTSPNAPAPPPPRRRGMSQPPAPPPSRQQQQYQQQYQGAPPLPPKIEIDSGYSVQQGNGGYQNGVYLANQGSATGSAADILGDLKALQNEVDRLQYYGN